MNALLFSRKMRCSPNAVQCTRIIWPVFLLFVFIFAAGPPEIFAQKIEMMKIAQFSAADPGGAFPAGWELLTFEKIPKHTDYRLVDDNGTTVIQAESDGSASGLIRKVRIDPHKYPIIEWRWKVTKIYQKGDISQKSGDDYPACIHIAFEYDPESVGFFERAKFKAIKILYGKYPPIGALNYIWACHAPEKIIVTNTYTDRIKMIVMESGEKNIGSWISESRNILDDYKAAYGSEPPMISGIAIMTDSDNTGESAQTYYGDIVMKSTQAAPQKASER